MRLCGDADEGSVSSGVGEVTEGVEDRYAGSVIERMSQPGVRIKGGTGVENLLVGSQWGTGFLRNR
jgi:hypothetical protein